MHVVVGQLVPKAILEEQCCCISCAGAGTSSAAQCRGTACPCWTVLDCSISLMAAVIPVTGHAPFAAEHDPHNVFRLMPSASTACAGPSLLRYSQGRTLTTAWVGDSRMVLGRQRKKGWRSSWEAIDLSVDHKPTIPEERQRILDSHGRVERWAHSACARLFAWCSKLPCRAAVCATTGDASSCVRHDVCQCS
jgi:hypothetical protein